MAVATCSTVVGVFPDRQKADMAIDDLYDAGFRSSEIGVMVRDPAGHVHNKVTGTGDRLADDTTVDTKVDAENAGEGAMTGAITGAGIGGLIGLGVLSGVIPVVGPALMAGTLGVIASNALGGAALAGLAGAMIGWGIPEEDARYYESEIGAGKVLVTVTSSDRCDEARSILRSHGGVSRESV